MQVLTVTFYILIGAFMGAITMCVCIASSDYKMEEFNSKQSFRSFKQGYVVGVSEFAEVVEKYYEADEKIVETVDGLKEETISEVYEND